MNKTKIKTYVASFSASSLDCETFSTPEEAFKLVTGGVPEVYYTQYIIDYDYNGSSSGAFTVYSLRDETDEECKERYATVKRLKENAKLDAVYLAEKKVKEEKALLEELKKKYESNF